MTRSAFRATLELENKQDATALSQVGFDLDVRDMQGQVAGERFNVRVTKLDGLSAIDGTGTIGALATGSAEWTLIPRDSAAPTNDTVYTIGGTIHYVQDGLTLSIPVIPVAITVRPDAALHLKYFHQRDVVSDDPHTDPVEAKEPFALAVVVENRGAGAARNLTIASAQPQIIDNEKGLLIDFEIIGTQMAGQPTLPSLTADFGTINPGQQKVATWWMTASLHGFFQDYSATFQHLDGFGDPRISLIKEVQIYEMIRAIHALGAQNDGQPDFLTNEQMDPADYPVADTLHLSNGSVTNVVFLGAGATSSATTNAMTFTLTLTNGSQTGWTYLRVPDPANGAFRLVGVTRSDGLVLPVGTNVWTTDRTFIGMGRKPVYENYLHLVDFGSAGIYTLSYEEKAEDTTPPQSAVSPLPAASGAFFPVRWSGSDNVALATYDIFVSTDGGPWTLWQDHVIRISAIYPGEANHTYAFYSRASDTAGNVETKTPAQEAVTTTSIMNQPPVITGLVNTNIAEGATLSYQVLATDPDGDSGLLRYTVASDHFGVSISSNGLIRWETSELDGRSTNRIMVSVMDGGIPVGITSAWFSVVVNEINIAPQLAAIEPQTVPGGERFVYRAQATDSDVPAQTLRYRLGSGSPQGMTLDPTTGLVEWTPGTNLVGQSFRVVVGADDNGAPPASGEAIFTVAVIEPLTDAMIAPEIRITTFDDIVPYSTQRYDISGTNNAYVVGTMFWTNAATGSGSGLPVNGSQFAVSNIALVVGHNPISVSGTNMYGQGANDSVIITRQTRFPNETFWWYQRGVLVGVSTNDYLAANVGQVKWIAAKAAEEFNAKLPGGAGSAITALVSGFANSNNYIVVNQGQLKAVAQPFYDRLWELGLTNAYPPGVTNRYPWSTNTPSDYNPANIGQLKYLFSFEVP